VSFEKFRKTTVFINLKLKTIIFHTETTKSYFLNYNRVKVFYEPSKRELMIQPITEQEDRLDDKTGSISIQLRYIENSNTSIIRPTKVFNKNKINHFNGHYEAIWDNEKKWLVINPNNKIEPAERRGKNKK